MRIQVEISEAEYEALVEAAAERTGRDMQECARPVPCWVGISDPGRRSCPVCGGGMVSLRPTGIEATTPEAIAADVLRRYLDVGDAEADAVGASAELELDEVPPQAAFDVTLPGTRRRAEARTPWTEVAPSLVLPMIPGDDPHQRVLAAAYVAVALRQGIGIKLPLTQTTCDEIAALISRSLGSGVEVVVLTTDALRPLGRILVRALGVEVCWPPLSPCTV